MIMQRACAYAKSIVARDVPDRSIRTIVCIMRHIRGCSQTNKRLIQKDWM